VPKNIKITPASGLFDFIGNSSSENTTKTSITLDTSGNLTYSTATGLHYYIQGLGLDSSKIKGTANQINSTHGGNNGEFTISLSNSVIFPGTARISSIPSVDTDIVNKLYVDALLGSTKIRSSVTVTTTGNIDLSSPGAIINGVTLSNGDRVLIKDQTVNTENGIYVFNGASSAMTRATDADIWSEFPSSFVIVEKGTVHADTIWICTSDTGGVLGSTPVIYVQLNGGVTLSPIGSAPNSAGASINSSQVLTLQPASASFGGVVTTLTQSFAGDKTFLNNITLSSLAGTGSRLVIASSTGLLSTVTTPLTDSYISSAAAWNAKVGSVGPIGSTPNANAASISSGVLTLQPASAAFGGVVTTIAQTFSGNKTFTDLLTVTNPVVITSGGYLKIWDSAGTNNIILQPYTVTYPSTFNIFAFLYNGALLGGFSQSGLQWVGPQTGYHAGGFDTSYFRTTPISGNYNFLTIGNTYGVVNPATTGSNVYNAIIINPSYNSIGGTNLFRGLYYKPALTSMVGATHIAFENYSGDVILNTNSGNLYVGTLATGLSSPSTSGSTKMLIVDANGLISSAAIPSGVVSILGTVDRIIVSGTSTVTIDIASTYVGQNSITTLGTIGTGTWQGTAITDTYISSAATWNAKVGSVGPIGGSPNANGASISGGVLTLQPADGLNGGVLTNSAQTISGHKTFVGRLILGNELWASGTAGTSGYILVSGGTGPSPSWQDGSGIFVDLTTTQNIGGTKIFNNYLSVSYNGSGVYLADGDVVSDNVGLYSGSGDQIIAVYDESLSNYYYGNATISINGSKTTFDTSISSVFISGDVNGGEVGFYSSAGNQEISTFGSGTGEYFYGNRRLTINESSFISQFTTDLIVYGQNDDTLGNFQAYTNTQDSYLRFGKYDGTSNDDGWFKVHIEGDAYGTSGDLNLNPEEGFSITFTNSINSSAIYVSTSNIQYNSTTEHLFAIGNVKISALSTGGSAPSTTGTLKMVVVDANGKLSFDNYPSGAGTVTSVALTMPGIFSVAGSPVTSSGTLAVTLATQSANVVFAGPSSGGAATPTFRSLALADLPSIPLSSLIAATGSNTINHANYSQEWQWNSLAGASGLKLSSTSTAAASNNQRLFEVSLSGTNSTSSQKTHAAYFSNTHTGTGSNNVGIYALANGGSGYNIAGWFQGEYAIYADGYVQVTSLSGVGTKMVIAYSDGTLATTSLPSNPIYASVAQITIPDSSDVYIRPDELAESNYSAATNLYLFENF